MTEDDLRGDITALVLMVLVNLLDYFVAHPIGSITAIFGLLLMYERWRSQRQRNEILRKRLDKLNREE